MQPETKFNVEVATKAMGRRVLVAVSISTPVGKPRVFIEHPDGTATVIPLAEITELHVSPITEIYPLPPIPVEPKPGYGQRRFA